MNMKLYFAGAFGLLFSAGVSSDSGSTMPFEQDNDAKLVFESGISWKSSSLEELYYYSLAYKRPGSLFRVPMHFNIEVGGFSGRRCGAGTCQTEERGGAGPSLSEFDTPIIGISQELRLVGHEYVDVTFALGGYLKRPSSRVGSSFTFGERLALNVHFSGYHLSAFIRHFSNASMTSDNNGHNFIGLSLSGKF